MRDDELEMWRRQWQGEPAEVVDLIRKVERGTVAMRMGKYLLLAPAVVASVATTLVAMSPSIGGILFVVGLWLFLGFSLWFDNRNMIGVLTPDAETTSAYLELSIERCKRGLRGFRVGRVMSVLVTAFVLFGVYQGLRSGGKLNNATSYWIVAATFLYTIAVVGFVMVVHYRAEKKTRAELEYLKDLQGRLSLRQEPET